MGKTASPWRWQRLLIIPILAGIWCVLTGGAASSWIVGIPVLLACYYVRGILPSEGAWMWRPRGLLLFLPFFLQQSVLSGVRVALLAMLPGSRLAPELQYYSLRLPGSPARVFFANTVSLLPGTLSCILAGDLLVVHVLDKNTDATASLQQLEHRVASLFGLKLATIADTKGAVHA